MPDVLELRAPVEPGQRDLFMPTKLRVRTWLLFGLVIGVVAWLVVMPLDHTILGVPMDNIVVRSVLGVGGVAVLAMIVFDVGKVVLKVPDATFTPEALIVRQFPRSLVVRWSAIRGVAQPVNRSLGFGHSVVTIPYVLVDGRTRQLYPPGGQSMAEEFHATVIEYWNRHGPAATRDL